MKILTALYLIIFFISAGADNVTGQNDFYVKSFTASIAGTSSLHDWKSDVTKLLCTGKLRESGGKFTEVADVVLTIPVTDIKSKEGRIMDNKTYAAFRSDANPDIIFKGNAKVIRDSAQFVLLQLNGTLSMAGVTKSVTLTPKAKRMANGDLEVSTAKGIDMTEFNMVPPRAMLGTLVVGRKVTITIDLIISRKSLSTTSTPN